MTNFTLTKLPAYKPAWRPRPASVPRGGVAFRNEAGRTQVLVSHAALEAICQATQSSARDEAIGFLAGRVFEDAGGFWTLVHMAYECQTAKRSRVTVQTSFQDLAELEAWYATDAMPFDRCGWWHSHCDLGADSYSDTDYGNQQRCCPREWQVGLLVVMEGSDMQLRCYRGPHSEPIDQLIPLTADSGASLLRIEKPTAPGRSRGHAAGLSDYLRGVGRTVRQAAALLSRLALFAARRLLWATSAGFRSFWVTLVAETTPPRSLTSRDTDRGV